MHIYPRPRAASVGVNSHKLHCRLQRWHRAGLRRLQVCSHQSRRNDGTGRKAAPRTSPQVARAVGKNNPVPQLVPGGHTFRLPRTAGCCCPSRSRCILPYTARRPDPMHGCIAVITPAAEQTGMAAWAASISVKKYVTFQMKSMLWVGNVT